MSMQATSEGADLEEDLEVANRNLRAALDASQQEVFEVYQQVRCSAACHANASRPREVAAVAPRSVKAQQRQERARILSVCGSSVVLRAQIEALEKQADEVVLLESRAELAESERDALLEVT